MKYRRDIDGLRALAVLPVVLYHAGTGIFSGGYVGVDIFFVISGFLITTLISDEIATGRFTIKNFYVRRIKRIFPALFFVLGSTVVLCLLFQMPYDFRNFGKSLSAAVFFCSNIYFNRQSGYFTDAAESKPLLHTWSLSIEEQFYIFFPLLLILIFRFFGGRFRPILLLIFTASLIYSGYTVGREQEDAFYLLLPRAWELLTGALLAYGILPRIKKPLAAEFIGAAGLLMIAYAVFFYDKNTLFPGYSAVLPCAGAAFVIYSGSFDTYTSRILSFRPLVFFGLISYSLYLWHWPLISLFNTYRPILILSEETAGIIIWSLILLSVILAAATYRYIETPFRRMNPAGAGRLFLISAVFMLVFGISGGVFYWTKGLPFRFPAEISSIDGGHDDIDKTSGCRDENLDSITYENLDRIGKRGIEPEFLLIGDSHAGAFRPGMDAYASKIGISGLAVSYSSLAPVYGIGHERKECTAEIPSKVFEIAMSKANIRTVILAARWNIYTDGRRDGSGREIILYDDRHAPIPAESKKNYIKQKLIETVTPLLKSGKRVVIIASVPEAETSVPEAMSKITFLNSAAGFAQTRDIRPSERAFNEQFDEINGMLKQVSDVTGASVVYPEVFFRNGDRFDLVKNGTSLYMDNNHLTRKGSVMLFENIGAEVLH